MGKRLPGTLLRSRSRICCAAGALSCQNKSMSVTHPRAAACRTLRGSTLAAHIKKWPPCSAAPQRQHNNARLRLAELPSGGYKPQLRLATQASALRPLRGRFCGLRAHQCAGPRLPCRGGPVCVRSAAGPSVCWSLRAAAPPPGRARSARCAAPRVRLCWSAAAAARSRYNRGCACCSARFPGRQPSRPAPSRRGCAPVPSRACPAFSAAARLRVGLRSALLRGCSGPPAA